MFFSFGSFYVYSCGGPSTGLRAPGGAQGDSPLYKPYASTELKKKKKKYIHMTEANGGTDSES